MTRTSESISRTVRVTAAAAFLSSALLVSATGGNAAIDTDPAATSRGAPEHRSSDLAAVELAADPITDAARPDVHGGSATPSARPASDAAPEKRGGDVASARRDGNASSRKNRPGAHRADGATVHPKDPEAFTAVWNDPDAIRSSNVLRSSMNGAEPGLLIKGAGVEFAANADGVGARVVTNDLRAGHSYTVWILFYNHPESCTVGPGDGFACGAVDLMANPAAGVSAVYSGGLPEATGRGDVLEGYYAAGEMPTTPIGWMEYVAWRIANNTSPVPGVGFHEQISSGAGMLVNPLGAEYQIVLWDHGPYDPDRFGEVQWQMHDGGCHVGEGWQCNDYQAAGAMNPPQM